MKRRGYIASVGSAITAGLTGCMDFVSSNPNKGENDGIIDNNNSQSGGVEIDFFTTAVNCTNGTEEVTFIGNPEKDKSIYEFNGQIIAPTSCHDAVASAELNDGTLSVNIKLVGPNGECDQDCTGIVSFAGSIIVEDDKVSTIENTELSV